MKKIFLSLFILAFAVSISLAGEKEVYIKSNPHCGNCKSKIEKSLNKTQGVNSSNLNLDSKIVTVKYDDSKTNPSQLTKVVTDLGFTADVVTPDQVSKKDNAVSSDKCTDKKDCSMGKSGDCCKDKSKSKHKTKTPDTESK